MRDFSLRSLACSSHLTVALRCVALPACLPACLQVPDALLMRTNDIFGETQSSFGMGDSLTLPPTRSSMGTASGKRPSGLGASGGRISPASGGSLSLSGGLSGIGRPASRGAATGTPGGEKSTTFTTGSKFRISTG